MLAHIRRIFVLACTAGGVYGSYYLLGLAVKAAGGGVLRPFDGEGLFLMLPCALVGASVGALLGGLIFPAKI